MAGLRVTEVRGGVRFPVRVVPRARQSTIEGLHGDALKVRLQAPPVDGAANEALIALIARSLRVAPSAVRIVSGATGRLKTIEVAGVTCEACAALASS